MELLDMESPLERDEESSDDNSGSPRLKRITDMQIPSTSRAANRAMEYVNSCSDLEVKKALDQTNFASKVKSIKQGDSHCQGEVSNSTDFRNTRCEVFLFDTGTGVSIIGEAIEKDNKIKVYKLKTPRKIVEASGNELAL